MSYALLDDQFYDHPKVIDLLEHDDGLAAVGLWTLALGWAKRHANPHCPEEAGRIPASLPRRLGGSTELAKLLVGVGLWVATGDGWVIHDFAERQDLNGWAKRSDRAKDAINARWKRDRERKAEIAASSSQEADTPSNTNVLPTSPHLTSPKEVQEPLAQPLPDGKCRAAAVAEPEPGSDADPQFTAFWAAYPRHVGKGQARKAWRTAIKRTTPETITDAARRYRDSQSRRSRPAEFTAHPSTWLNGERWLDQPDRETSAFPQHESGYSYSPWEN